MGGGGTKHIYHEDTESKAAAAAATAAAEAAKTLAEQAQAALTRQQQETQNLQTRYEQERADAVKEAKERQAAYERHMAELKRQHDEAAAAAAQRLEEQRRARANAEERARAQAVADAQRLRDEQAQRAQAAADHARALEEQRAAAERHHQEELQRERDRVHAERLAKWTALMREYPVPKYLEPFVTQMSETAALSAEQPRFINIGFLGNSGVGKSSLIRAVLKFFDCLDPEHMPRPCVEGDGTRAPERYALPRDRFGAAIVSVWDLPGQGTAAFPAQTYLREMGLKHFDVVVITTDGRWSEGDNSLFQAIRFAGTSYCVARTKIDRAVQDGQNDAGLTVSQVLERVQQTLAEQLPEPNADRLHLVTTRPKEFGKIDGLCHRIVQLVEEELAEQAGHRREPQGDEQMPNADDLMDVDIGPEPPLIAAGGR